MTWNDILITARQTSTASNRSSGAFPPVEPLQAFWRSGWIHHATSRKPRGPNFKSLGSLSLAQTWISGPLNKRQCKTRSTSSTSRCEIKVVGVGSDNPVATACHYLSVPLQRSNAGTILALELGSQELGNVAAAQQLLVVIGVLRWQVAAWFNLGSAPNIPCHKFCKFHTARISSFHHQSELEFLQVALLLSQELGCDHRITALNRWTTPGDSETKKQGQRCDTTLSCDFLSLGTPSVHCSRPLEVTDPLPRLFQEAAKTMRFRGQNVDATPRVQLCHILVAQKPGKSETFDVAHVGQPKPCTKRYPHPFSLQSILGHNTPRPSMLQDDSWPITNLRR